MGFFSKLKNAVTGGAAEVNVEIGEAVAGEGLPVKVVARAQSTFKINRVYLLVRASEEAVVRDIDVHRDGGLIQEDVHGEIETCNMEINIADAMTLEEGADYEWETTVELPEDVNPTFRGEIIRHTWQLQAGLDAFGNDPDSGWIEFDVA